MEQDGAFPGDIWAHPALLLGKDFLKDDSRHPAFLPQLQKQPDGQAVDAAMWMLPGTAAPSTSQALTGLPPQPGHLCSDIAGVALGGCV